MRSGHDPGTPGASPKGQNEDLIESDSPSARAAELRRRLDLLIPPSIGRKVLGGIAIAALALGLVAGLLVGNATEDHVTDQASIEASGPSDGGVVPVVPESEPVQDVMVWSVGIGSLTTEDLAGLGETALTGVIRIPSVSGLDGLCGITRGPESVPLPEGPSTPYSVYGSSIVTFRLIGASLTQQVTPYYDGLAAATHLHGMVGLAQTCPSPAGLTVGTDGVAPGIGDEYAVFTVRRPDPESGAPTPVTSVVVLVRVEGQLIEISLSPESGTEVPDGLNRALAIAALAAERVRAG